MKLAMKKRSTMLMCTLFLLSTYVSAATIGLAEFERDEKGNIIAIISKNQPMFVALV